MLMDLTGVRYCAFVQGNEAHLHTCDENGCIEVCSVREHRD